MGPPPAIVSHRFKASWGWKLIRKVLQDASYKSRSNSLSSASGLAGTSLSRQSVGHQSLHLGHDRALQPQLDSACQIIGYIYGGTIGIMENKMETIGVNGK